MNDSGKRYIGLDVHKHYLIALAVDEELQVVLPARRVELSHLEAWMKKNITRQDQVVLEMTTNTWQLYDELVEYAGPRDKDQYNFTDPESRIMKNSANDGFDQHYNVQAAVDQDSLLIVATSLSNHPNDKREAEPTLNAISPRLGKPAAAALDNGFYSEHNILALEQRSIEPYIATGREAHRKNLKTLLGTTLPVPPDDATPLEKMAYKLSTEIGQAIYRLRKCTVEPVIGIIKEILGFRQFSLRGLKKVAGEWCLVCLAFNLKRLHVLMTT